LSEGLYLSIHHDTLLQVSLVLEEGVEHVLVELEWIETREEEEGEFERRKSR